MVSFRKPLLLKNFASVLSARASTQAAMFTIYTGKLVCNLINI